MRRRGPGPGTRRALLVVGVAGIVVALVIGLLPRSTGTKQRMLVAAEPIAAGTLLDTTVLREVTVRGEVPIAGLTEPSTIVGRRTVSDLLPGEPVTEASLGGGVAVPSPLTPGERAVPVPAAAAGVGPAGVLRPGTLVDVVASSGEGPAGRTSVIVAGAEVLSSDAADDSGLGGAVLLRASAKESLRITAALNFARDVRLLARPLGEPVARVLP